MNVTINERSWHGQNAWALENDSIQTIVVPAMGAKLVSIFDKRTQHEWLVGPGERDFKQVPYGADFVEQDMSGWDEMFPTIVACDYPAPGRKQGLFLPDHGEVWPLPWTIEQTQPDALRCSVAGVALRYRLRRTVTFCAPDSLQIYYELQNLESESMPYLWSAHPQFICYDGAEIVLPAHINEVCNTLPAEWGWGEPESRLDWPEATTFDDQQVRIDHIGPSSLKQARKFFVLPGKSVSWAGLIRQSSKDWLRLDWDPDLVPYLGLWIDEGRLSHESVAALEPMTGFYDSLAVAWEKQKVATIEPGEIKTWTLSVCLGAGDQPFPSEDRESVDEARGAV